MLWVAFIGQIAFFVSTYLYVNQHPWLLLIAGISFNGVIGYMFHQRSKQIKNADRSLEQGLLSLVDSDFSVSIPTDKEDNRGPIFELFNQCADKLRKERQHLYQREMLLDKVLNTSPVVTFLLDINQKIIFANRAAEQMFNDGNSILGYSWSEVCTNLNSDFVQALQQSGESIFTLKNSQGEEQAWHLAKSGVRIHQANNTLYLLKSITNELSRQEVQTWKKVIRVISHELNNSIAPISSMCHSGQLLAQNLDEPRLDRVFSSISRRIGHLNEFIKGYGALSKLKIPDKRLVDWTTLFDQIGALYRFDLITDIPNVEVYADEHQIEQVLINILKNAHEAQSETDKVSQVTMAISAVKPHGISIEISDTGLGMAPEVLENALLPFYSTKHAGTGLGLALCREIIEAHQGKLSFYNRKSGGLTVSIFLPSAL
ncbi:GHKL domain-containing protein [Pseudoalteromonas luteoviolacea]|uniref:sensor histidine kinase n=1 Tax=Pseudoalteromonas luteoviolacea TaxID=43657 RepID=UPI001B377DBD|nr:ATP-binding protein [Pseudoalteromonas luteoviolacea]MBQ4811629.1 GHKL domain-containing protein [Pseudoalteromonas luteoviolacea]